MMISRRRLKRDILEEYKKYGYDLNGCIFAFDGFLQKKYGVTDKIIDVSGNVDPISMDTSIYYFNGNYLQNRSASATGIDVISIIKQQYKSMAMESLNYTLAYGGNKFIGFYNNLEGETERREFQAHVLWQGNILYFDTNHMADRIQYNATAYNGTFISLLLNKDTESGARIMINGEQKASTTKNTEIGIIKKARILINQSPDAKLGTMRIYKTGRTNEQYAKNMDIDRQRYGIP